MPFTIWTVPRIIFAIILIFLLPGYAFTKMLFPRRKELEKENEWIAVLALSIGMSICISILDFFILAAWPVPQGQKGHFTTFNIVWTLLAWSLLFGTIAYFRGAFPWLGRSPTQKSLEGIKKEKHQERLNFILDEYEEMAKKREELLARQRMVSRKSRASSRTIREHYNKERARVAEEIDALDEKIKEFEGLRWEELAEIEKIRLKKEGYVEVDETGNPVDEDGEKGKPAPSQKGRNGKNA